jgi:hypothetical protein
MCAGAAPPVLWVALRLFTRPGATAYALLDFASYRQLSNLPPFDYTVPFPSRWAFLADKAMGLGEAFDPLGDWSYVQQFGLAALAVPVAFVVLGYQVLRGRNPTHRWARPRHSALLASACTGILAVVPVHLIHSLQWYTWTFAWRQGLAFCLVIVPALLWLLTRLPRAGRVVLLGVFVAGSVPAARRAISAPDSEVSPAWLDTRRQVGRHLDQVAHGSGTLGIEPQPVAAFSDAPLHWLACWSPPALADELTRALPIHRVVLTPDETRCPSLAKVRDRLVLERTFGTRYPMSVFRLQR